MFHDCQKIVQQLHCLNKRQRAHAGTYTRTRQLLAVSFAGVLRPTIAVEHQPLGMTTKILGNDQCAQHQAGCHGFIDRPANDAARVDIYDNRQIHPAFTRAAVGHVTRPNLIWRHWVEVLIQQIIRHRIAVFAFSRHFVRHTLSHLKVHPFHQTEHTIAPNLKTFRAKCFHQLSTAKARTALCEQLLHPAAKRELLSAEYFARAFAPVVKRRFTDLHYPA